MQSNTALKDYWRKQLTHHDWYVRLEDFLETVIFPLNATKEEKRLRSDFYELVDIMLQNSEIPLAEKRRDNPNFDEEREKIDTIIIHHTDEVFDISHSRLSAIGLIRQYAKAYLEDNIWQKSKLRGQPIWSGHFDEKGKMVFYAYHFLIRLEGKTDRLLKDGDIGHHSGIQTVNNRSIGIALSGDYNNSIPPKKQLLAIKKLINSKYPEIKIIAAHKEVRPDRICPGNKWEEWKKEIMPIFPD